MATSDLFKTRLEELVSDSNVPKSKLPKAMGIDYRSFSGALNYGILPRTRTLIKIADYFRVSLAFLLGKTDDDTFEPSALNETFADRIVLLCDEKKITQYFLAMKCHFDKSYFSRWLGKKYLPELEFSEIIADYFGVSLDYLLGRTDYRI